jgi:hypothetical protein
VAALLVGPTTRAIRDNELASDDHFSVQVIQSGSVSEVTFDSNSETATQISAAPAKTPGTPRRSTN